MSYTTTFHIHTPINAPSRLESLPQPRVYKDHSSQPTLSGDQFVAAQPEPSHHGAPATAPPLRSGTLITGRQVKPPTGGTVVGHTSDGRPIIQVRSSYGYRGDADVVERAYVDLSSSRLNYFTLKINPEGFFETEDKIKKVKDEISNLGLRLATRSFLVPMKEKEIPKLQQEVDAWQKTFDEEKEKFEALDKKTKTSEQELANKTNDHNKAKDKVKDAELTVIQKEAEVEAYTEALDKAIKDKLDSGTLPALVQNSLQQAVNKYQAAKGQLETKTTERDNAKSERADIEGKFRDKAKELKDDPTNNVLKGELATLATQKINAIEKLRRAEQEVIIKQAAFNTARASREIEYRDVINGNPARGIAAPDPELQKKLADLNNSKQELNDAKANLVSARVDLTKKENDLTATDKVHKKNEKSKNDASEAENTAEKLLKEAKKKLADAEKEINDLKDEGAIKKEIATKKGELANLGKKLAQLKLDSKEIELNIASGILTYTEHGRDFHPFMQQKMIGYLEEAGIVLEIVSPERTRNGEPSGMRALKLGGNSMTIRGVNIFSHADTDKDIEILTRGRVTRTRTGRDGSINPDSEGRIKLEIRLPTP
ncbi:MAG: hypothetical protein HYY52_07080 [Candidatus Melainabacteria bacterium]|nr:hypothetical protein [Candidatus Melainabacteria bacterium]